MIQNLNIFYFRSLFFFSLPFSWGKEGEIEKWTTPTSLLNYRPKQKPPVAILFAILKCKEKANVFFHEDQHVPPMCNQYMLYTWKTLIMSHGFAFSLVFTNFLMHPIEIVVSVPYKLKI